MSAPAATPPRQWEFQLSSVEDLKKLSQRLGVAVDAIEDVSILSTPVKLSGLVIPNSLSVHAMEGCDGDALGRPSKLTVRRYERFGEVSDNPWRPDAAPAAIRCKAIRLPEWQTYRDEAGPLPPSPLTGRMKLHGDTRTEITLIPYGCTNLRIAVFPTAR